MALEASDLMVVQKQSGAKEIRKATLQALSDYIQTSPGVVYKGVADFTNAGENPALVTRVTSTSTTLFLKELLLGLLLQIQQFRLTQVTALCGMAPAGTSSKVVRLMQVLRRSLALCPSRLMVPKLNPTLRSATQPLL